MQNTKLNQPKSYLRMSKERGLFIFIVYNRFGVWRERFEKTCKAIHQIAFAIHRVRQCASSSIN